MKLTLTEAVALTPEAVAERFGISLDNAVRLLARRERRLEQQCLNELEADLPAVLRAANLDADLEGRRVNGVSRGAQIERAAAAPSHPDDVLGVRTDDGRDLILNDEDGPRVRLRKGRKSFWLKRAQYDAVGAQGPGLWERQIVFCASPHADLRARIRAGFENVQADEGMGRPRFPWESETDTERIDAFVAVVVSETTDRATLESWLQAAGEQQHAIPIRERLDKLFAAKAPDFWGPKDDKLRAASPIGHAVVGARG